MSITINDLDEYNAIVADANRYRAVRALVCETDKAKQERMLDAIDTMEPPQLGDACTPEQFNEFADLFIAALAGARDANG